MLITWSRSAFIATFGWYSYGKGDASQMQKINYDLLGFLHPSLTLSRGKIHTFTNFHTFTVMSERTVNAANW